MAKAYPEEMEVVRTLSTNASLRKRECERLLFAHSLDQ
jgi:hypothetical protein